METTERIVNSYCNYVEGWFTIQNIGCAGHQEIDILAINPKARGKKKRYHIECSVSISQAYSKLTNNPYDDELRKQRVHVARQRMTIGYFAEQKFGSPHVTAKLAEYGFEGDNYTKAIVAWGWRNWVAEAAAEEGIELWSFTSRILDQLTNKLGSCSGYFDDDTCRTIQLITKAQKASSKG